MTIGEKIAADFCENKVHLSSSEQRRLATMIGGGIPEHAICVFMDGMQWCAVFGDFINLQESVSGFGDTIEKAISALRVASDLADSRGPQ